MTFTEDQNVLCKYRGYTLLKDDKWAQSSKAAMEYNTIFYYSSSEYYGSSSSTIVHGNHFPIILPQSIFRNKYNITPKKTVLSAVLCFQDCFS